MINALFGEVTVLGFIALVTFFMIKSGIFQQLSMLIYGDQDHLLHLFETVHFGLFFTMMLYLGLVMWVLFVQVQTRNKWAELEEQTKRFLRDAGVGQQSKAANLPSTKLAKFGVRAQAARRQRAHRCTRRPRGLRSTGGFAFVPPMRRRPRPFPSSFATARPRRSAQAAHNANAQG